MRRLSRLVAYCALYEFEDVVASVTDADRVEVDNEAALELSRRAYKYSRLLTRSNELARKLAPSPSTVSLRRDYELFFPIFNHPHELYALSAIPDWRKRCRVAMCFVSEVWIHLLPGYLLELLALFDHVFIGMSHPVPDVARIVGRPCTYLPLAADVVKFSPWPQPPSRSIDVCNIGRRSATTHQAFINAARTRSFFYYYDTFAGGGENRKQRTFRVENHDEHRLLLANILKRSRYYVANRSRINEPEHTANREELSGRFYEGAAAGAVMIGEAPKMQQFEAQFGWTDSVIHLPFDSPDAVERLDDLGRDGARIDRIQRENARQGALRHDWLYRLRTVFDTAGIAPTPKMMERERQLRALADLAAPGN